MMMQKESRQVLGRHFEAPPRVLLAEDEWYMAHGIRHLFVREGYEVVCVDNGKDALRLLLEDACFDIAIVDVMMPEMDGFTVLSHARAEGVGVPVVIVSGKATESDRVRGLRLGADDYVTKPFSRRELLARVRAVCRRGEGTRPLPRVIRVGDVTANFRRFVALRGEESMHFTPLEWSVLRHLAHRGGEAVSREEFNVKVLGIPPDIATRTIDRHVYALRCKIDRDPKNPRHLLRVTGVGYRLAEFEILS